MNTLYDTLRRITGIGSLLIIVLALMNPRLYRNIKFRKYTKKIAKLQDDISRALKLCEIEIMNRRNGVPGESTVEQLEEIVIPELKQVLYQITNSDKFPEKDQRVLRFLSDARVSWGWNTRTPTPLFALLMEVNEEYNQLLD